jgi:hypothetical protein
VRTFAAENLNRVLTLNEKANETDKKILAQFPDLAAKYYNVRATGEYRNSF